MMLKLRQLKAKDAYLMLEWMHDMEIQKCFQKNMQSATLETAKDFCEKAVIPEQLSDGDSVHFAIADENDEYLGTISLKNIDLIDKKAEYAIAMRKKAQGKSLGIMATGLVLRKAFEEYDLDKVYLNVLEDNVNAIKMYERSGFKYNGTYGTAKVGNEYKNLKWFSMQKSEFYYDMFSSAGERI